MARASGSTSTSARGTVSPAAPTIASVKAPMSTSAFSTPTSRTMATAGPTNFRTTRPAFHCSPPATKAAFLPTMEKLTATPDIQVGSVILGGNHVLDTTWYTWEANVGRSTYGNSPYSDAFFKSTLASSHCELNPGATKNEYLPQWNQGLVLPRSRIRPTSPSVISTFATSVKLCS